MDWFGSSGATTPGTSSTNTGIGIKTGSSPITPVSTATPTSGSGGGIGSATVNEYGQYGGMS